MNREFQVWMNGKLEATFASKNEAMNYSWNKKYLYPELDGTNRWVKGWKLIMKFI